MGRTKNSFRLSLGFFHDPGERSSCALRVGLNFGVKLRQRGGRGKRSVTVLFPGKLPKNFLTDVQVTGVKKTVLKSTIMVKNIAETELHPGNCREDRDLYKFITKDLSRKKKK